MRSIAPRTGAPELSVARDQPEFYELVGAAYEVQGVPTTLFRFTLDEEERKRIAEGEDIYLAIMTGGAPMQPIMIQTGPEGWTADTGAHIPTEGGDDGG